MERGRSEQGDQPTVLSDAERRRFEEIAERLAPELDDRPSRRWRLRTGLLRGFDRWAVGPIVVVVGLLTAVVVARQSIVLAAIATGVALVGMIHVLRHVERWCRTHRRPGPDR